MKNNKKFGRSALIVALLVVVSVASIAGTVAWLQDKTATITNTFAPSNITLTLEETGAEQNEDNENLYEKKFHLVPGVEISKDPSVSASSDVDYFVFVKVTKNWPTNATIAEKISYSIDPAWGEALTGSLNSVANNESVYCIAKSANQAINKQPVLQGNKITVSSELTKEELATLKNNEPTLSFTAYAIQQQDGGSENGGKFTEVEAWNALNPNP